MRITETNVKLGAVKFYRFDCFMCSGYNHEEAETIEELTANLNSGGWEDTQIGDSVGIFCPECIEADEEE